MSDPTIGSRAVKVRELSVKEIRAHLQKIEPTGDDDFDMVGKLLFDDCDFETITLMTDLNPADFGEALPSELRLIARECMDVNSHFFGMARRMGLLLEQVEKVEKPNQDGESATSKSTAPHS